MSNPLFQGNREPVMILGAIMGKGTMDYSLVTQFKENANNNLVNCYPGGGSDINHDIMPTFMVFGLRHTRTVNAADGDTEANEVGIVSVAGLNWGSYCSQRQMEDDYYFQGISVGEQRLTKPNDDVTDETDTGYATVKTGTITVPNNGPYMFYPGTAVCTRFPLAPYHPRSGAGNNNNQIESINQYARDGEPITMLRPQYVPFDPTDFSVQLAAVYAAITQANDSNNPDGIANLPFVNALPHLMGDTGCRPWSCLQDEAISYKFGYLGIGLTFVETLIRKGYLQRTLGGVPGPIQTAAVAHSETEQLADTIHTWSSNVAEQGVIQEFIADLFLKNASPLDVDANNAVERFRAATGKDYLDIVRKTPADSAEHYQNLRAHVNEILLQGIMGSIHHKLKSVIGFSTNTAGPADQLDLCLGHHRH